MYTPDTVILDLDKAVTSLTHRARRHLDSVESGHYVNEMIEEVVNCLAQDKTSLSNLMTYADATRYRYHRQGDSDLADTVAEDIMALGQDLYAKLKRHGLYRNGGMDYLFSGRSGKNNIILSHFGPARID